MLFDVASKTSCANNGLASIVGATYLSVAATFPFVLFSYPDSVRLVFILAPFPDAARLVVVFAPFLDTLILVFFRRLDHSNARGRIERRIYYLNGVFDSGNARNPDALLLVRMRIFHSFATCLQTAQLVLRCLSLADKRICHYFWNRTLNINALYQIITMLFKFEIKFVRIPLA